MARKFFIRTLIGLFSTMVMAIVLCVAVFFVSIHGKNSEKIFSFFLNRHVNKICADCSVSLSNFNRTYSEGKRFQINTGLEVRRTGDALPICSIQHVSLDFDLSKILSEHYIQIKIKADSLNARMDLGQVGNLSVGGDLFAKRSFLAPEILEIKNSSLILNNEHYKFDLDTKMEGEASISFLTVESSKHKASIESRTIANKTEYKIYNLPIDFITKSLPATFQNKLLDVVGKKLFISGKIETELNAKIQKFNANFYNQIQNEKHSAETPKFVINLASNDLHDKILIKKISLELPQGKGAVEASGYVQHISRMLNTKTSLLLKYKTDNLTLKDAYTIWPTELASSIREWMMNSMREGRIKNLAGQIEVKDIFSTEYGNTRWKGQSDFQDLSLKYLEEFPQLNGLNGIINFNNDNVIFNIQDGKMINVDIKEGASVRIALSEKDYPLLIDLKASGPITDFINFIPKENLAELEKKKIDLKKINGTTDAIIKIKIPLAKDLTLDNLSLDVDANLKDTDFYVLEKFRLQGDLSLNIHDHLLSISGDSLLNDNNSKFKWQTHLKDKMEFDNKLDIETVFDTSQKNLSLLNDKISVTKGKIFSNIQYIHKDKDESFALHANLDEALIYMKDFNLLKDSNKKAEFNLMAINKDSKGWTTKKCDFISNEEYIKAISYVELSNNLEDIKKFESLIEYKENNVKISFVDQNEEAKFSIEGDHITPNKNHLLEFLNSQNFSKNKKTSFNVKINRASMSNGVSFEKVLGEFECHNSICKHSALTMRIVDTENPRSLLKIYKKGNAIMLRTNNAAAFLRGLNIYKNISGGSMLIQLQPSTTRSLHKDHFKGKIYIKNFKAIKTPILAKLILMTPFTQIVEQLKGQQLIGFEEFKGNFIIRNNVVTIEKALATGEFLSATIEGHIDLTNNSLKLNGKLIPKCLLNKFMSGIQKKKDTNPDKFQIATEYKIDGKLDDPKISVNPVSVLVSIFTKPLAMF
jgi:hypothetical protein